MFLLSEAMNGKDGQGLKLKKVGPTFSHFNVMPTKITQIIIVMIIAPL